MTKKRGKDARKLIAQRTTKSSFPTVDHRYIGTRKRRRKRSKENEHKQLNHSTEIEMSRKCRSNTKGKEEDNSKQKMHNRSGETITRRWHCASVAYVRAPRLTVADCFDPCVLSSSTCRRSTSSRPANGRSICPTASTAVRRSRCKFERRPGRDPAESTNVLFACKSDCS